MITNSLDKQFSLSETGEVLWQKDLTDPRPGEPIAKLVKGAEALRPDCQLIETAILNDQDKEAVLDFTKQWLLRHVEEVLGPLFRLQDANIADGAPKEIAQKLYEALGILPREDLQELIDKMEEEGRATLRTKKIRFGPIIVYLPELNKPAGVAMQALLLSIWEDKPLPAEKPAEGIVSFSKEGKDINPDYYRSIGYPVYGPRVIRVDMLDRVICAVYDSADKGKFEAQHQMAEWLGCNITDLYAVLEAMGHQKISDPADDVQESDENAEVKPEATEQASEEAPKEMKKPPLATFRLKKGKASGASAEKKKKYDGFKASSKSKKPKKKKDSKPRQRVYTAEAESKPEDSPFAILEQLKTGNKDG
ncbi:MAG: hypothetical protein AAGB32_01035 [Pseudomonadota bacterium]